MICYQIGVRGNWGHFRRAETNNNALTHDFLTKTALIGLIGAVLGIERNKMRSLFPILSTQLKYGVRINKIVKKESWAFTLRNVFRQNNSDGKAPRPMEFLRDPDFTVMIAVMEDVEPEIAEIATRFASAIRNSEAQYTPVLGLHNCPAELIWISEGITTSADGEYRTKGFCLRDHRPASTNGVPFRLGFERVPTFQTEDWVSPPEHYREVVYPSNGAEIAATGQHYRSDSGEAWCLI